MSPEKRKKRSILDHEGARELFFDLVSGDMTLLEIPDSGEYDPGQLALLGAFIMEIGNRMISQGKKEAARGIMENGRGVDHGVIFEERSGGKVVRLNSRAVQENFPKEEYPDLYQTSTRRGYVTMRLPL